MPIVVRSKRAKEQKAPSLAGVRLPALPAPPPGWPQKPPGVSLCMIVKNEEQFLPQCLASIKDYVDEIIVVDTGSSDRTVEIAQSYGATVLHRPWRNDFAWARNESIVPAKYRWILFMDADEELPEKSRAPLLAIKNCLAHHMALWVRIYNRTDDYRGSGEVSHALIRVFPNDEQIRFRGLIHEFPALVDSTVGIDAVASDIEIIHHGYVADVVKQRNKASRNLEILQEATAREPEDPYHWYNLGTTAYLMQDFPLALEALEKMRTLVGDGSRAFMPNGLTLLSDLNCDFLGNPERAEELANESLKRSPHYANAHMMLGKTLYARRRWEEARAAFTKAIEDGAYAKNQFIVDDQVYIWKAQSELGSCWAAEGNDLKALEWFEAGLKNAPKVEPLMINRAKALERLGRQSEAYAAYKGVFDLHQSGSSMLYFVNYLLRVQRHDEALAIVEEWYPKLPPTQGAELLVGAAAVAEKYGTGNRERYLRLAAQLDPELPQLKQALLGSFAQWSDRARTALQERNGQTAFEAVEHALAIEPKSFDMLMSRAAALELLASPAGVEASLLRAKDVDEPRAAVALSMFYLRHERFTEAAAIADGALKQR
jgi:glycosyltransferase involved in cell wall biosynthesis